MSKRLRGRGVRAVVAVGSGVVLVAVLAACSAGSGVVDSMPSSALPSSTSSPPRPEPTVVPTQSPGVTEPVDADGPQSSCDVPILDDAVATELAPLLAEYDGMGGPGQYYGYEGIELGSPSAAITFTNIYDGYSLFVDLLTGPLDSVDGRVKSYEGFAAWRTELGEAVTPIDAPGYSWAATSTTDMGITTATYGLVGSDRYFRVEFFDLDGVTSMDPRPKDPAAATAAAEALRAQICGASG